MLSFFFSSRRRHTRSLRDWSSDVCSSDLECLEEIEWPVWRESRTGSAFTELCIRHGDFAVVAAAAQVEIGRASCRERVWIWGGSAGGKRKKKTEREGATRCVRRTAPERVR